MNISMKLSLALLSIFMLAFLTYGCAHRNASQEEAGITYSNPVVTMGNSDFYALDLSGENEIPTPNSGLNASGKLFLKVGEKGEKIYFTLYVDSLKNITKATINYGTKNYNGPPIVTLYPARHTFADSLVGRTFSGKLNAGVLVEAYLDEGALDGGKISDFVRAMKNDSTYIQIHTKYIRNGAIRAQIKSSQATVSEK